MTQTKTEETEARPCEGVEPLVGSYFVSTYPPFSSWRKEDARKFELSLDQAPTGGADLGLYIHIPFCEIRCQFCYYLSYARQSPARIDGYIDSLINELTLYGNRPRLRDRPLSYVYFGGGTPSVLSDQQINRLTGAIKGLFPWTDAREVTYECAPRSVTTPVVHALRDAGVTRISMGVQQLDNRVLELNGRIHRVDDVERAYAAIREMEFSQVNLDLMVGLVGETEESFFESLDRIVEMAPDSITFYQLEIPLNTPLYKALDKTVAIDDLATWETKRERLGTAYADLERKGYHLRSAYTAVRSPKQGFVYQDAQYHGADLLGIGASAFSYIDGVHCQNLASLRAYTERLDAGQLPSGRAYRLNERERLVREFILQLKLGEVSRTGFSDKFGVDLSETFEDPLERFADLGWVDITDDSIRLTRQGLLRVDRLLPDFYLPEHRNIRYS